MILNLWFIGGRQGMPRLYRSYNIFLFILSGYERNLGGFLVEYRLAQNQSLLVYIPYNPKNRLAKGVRT